MVDNLVPRVARTIRYPARCRRSVPGATYDGLQVVGLKEGGGAVVGVVEAAGVEWAGAPADVVGVTWGGGWG